MLIPVAIVIMFTALAMYSIGVWGEKIAGILKKKHLIFFWIGFVFDTTGTTIMSKIAGDFKFNMHGITGLLAILLMLGHAIWATLVLVQKNEKILKVFHRYSLVVWAIWLIPFVSGLVLGMGN